MGFFLFAFTTFEYSLQVLQKDAGLVLLQGVRARGEKGPESRLGSTPNCLAPICVSFLQRPHMGSSDPL